MPIIALDTESTYEKGRDIRSLGVSAYVRHPETKHYMVSLYRDGFAWVGAPEDAPWDRIAGATVLSHNAAYDKQVLAELRRRGLPVPTPARWHCTADLAAYLQSPRSLADSSRELLGVKLDKSTRDKMFGTDWDQADFLLREEVARYALLDAKACFSLWSEHAQHWPDHEVAASDHTAMMGARGIGLDLDAARSGIKTLQLACWTAAQSIPWFGELDLKGKAIPTSSVKMIAEHCRAAGIEPPATTDTKSDAWSAWEETNGSKAPFIAAIQRWRQANRLLAVLETFLARQIDGRLPYSLKYFGATHTGRWSGDTGLNLQNLPRKPVAAVDARGCLIPASGKKFIIADLAQIEARVLAWLAGDTKTLDMLRAGIDIYEAHARNSMGYSDPRPLKEVDSDKRQFAKCRVLALGFGLGAGKFQAIVKLWTGLEISEAAAKQMVSDFRRTNPGIVRLWKTLEQTLRASTGSDMETELPSGRTIRYFDVAELERGLAGRVERGDARKNLYGGLLAENCVQATARDLFAQAILKLEVAGLPVVLHVHDEVIVEIDANDASNARDETLSILRQTPDWAPGLPIDASAEITDRYGK